MTKSANAKATVSVTGQIKLGKANYELHEAMAHGAMIYDKLYLLQEQQLDYYRELGNILIQARSLFKSDKLFCQYLAKSDLGSMSRQDRSDAMFIAANWTTVQKLNKNGALESLGVSAIRKRCKAAEAPKKPSSAGNVSKGKAAAQKDTSPKGEPTVGSSDTKPTVFQTEDELAKFVAEMLKANGLNKVQFTKALTKAVKA